MAAAASATLVGNGLARFAYSPLLPVLIAQGWFAPGAAAYLGAANLLGYFIGAMAARHAAARLGARGVLRGAMLVASISLLACSVPMPFAWFFVWRLVSGITGGLLMIIAPSLVLPLVPPAHRGLASGLIFTGVGLGIAASGTLVPLLLSWSLTAAWLALGGVSLVLTLLAWRAWPAHVRPAATQPTHVKVPRGSTLISISYGLFAVGMVPHMIFLVDYVARGQGRGLAAGSIAWIMFGIGAACGAVVFGRMADRIGAAPAMTVVIVAQFACLLALAFVQVPVASGVAALVSGLCLSGITSTMLGRVQDAAGADPVARQRGWTEATVAWAIGQASAAYGLAWLYARTGGYSAILGTAGAALVLAAGLEGWMALSRRGQGQVKPDCATLPRRDG